jgi:hypothetical protein
VPRRTKFAPSKLVNAILEKRWSSTSASLACGRPYRPLRTPQRRAGRTFEVRQAGFETIRPQRNACAGVRGRTERTVRLRPQLTPASVKNPEVLMGSDAPPVLTEVFVRHSGSSNLSSQPVFMNLYMSKYQQC